MCRKPDIEHIFILLPAKNHRFYCNSVDWNSELEDECYSTFSATKASTTAITMKVRDVTKLRTAQPWEFVNMCKGSEGQFSSQDSPVPHNLFWWLQTVVPQGCFYTIYFISLSKRNLYCVFTLGVKSWGFY